MSSPIQIDPEEVVLERYAAAAQEREGALCCPVGYDPRYLEVIPEEVIERDYGCGDPSRYVREGDIVLDLGSGGGKVCFIAAQVTGPTGRVIGVDLNDEMLALARGAAPVVADRIGFRNVEFKRGRIQDLALELDQLDSWLADHPVLDSKDVDALRREEERLRREESMIATASVDIVVSNCVLNLVGENSKRELIREIYRVLKRGGRIAISDIVADATVPAELKARSDLWSGCISGAFHELDLLREFEAAGFYGIRIDKWESEPFAVVDEIEFRSVTVTGYKGKDGPCDEAGQAVVYAGPWKRVEDDDGHLYERGVRTAVCAKTFAILTTEPYSHDTIGIEPQTPIPESDRAPFDCTRTAPRDPRETRGGKRVRGADGSARCC